MNTTQIIKTNEKMMKDMTQQELMNVIENLGNTLLDLGDADYAVYALLSAGLSENQLREMGFDI